MGGGIGVGRSATLGGPNGSRTTTNTRQQYEIYHMSYKYGGPGGQSPRKLQDFHKTLLQLWHFRGHLPR